MRAFLSACVTIPVPMPASARPPAAGVSADGGSRASTPASHASHPASITSTQSQGARTNATTYASAPHSGPSSRASSHGIEAPVAPAAGVLAGGRSGTGTGAGSAHSSRHTTREGEERRATGPAAAAGRSSSPAEGKGPRLGLPAICTKSPATAQQAQQAQQQPSGGQASPSKLAAQIREWERRLSGPLPPESPMGPAGPGGQRAAGHAAVVQGEAALSLSRKSNGRGSSSAESGEAAAAAEVDEARRLAG